MKTAIVLLSAGLDSTVSLALAREAGVSIRLGLCFDYGQRAAAAEWRQAQLLAAHYQLPLQRIELPWLAEISTSALSSKSTEALPQVPVEQLDNITSVTLASAAKVWVPNRNGALINIAAAFADAGGESLILTGFNAEEAATFPDNTPQFAEAISRSLAFSTQVQPQVKSFVQHLNKVEILREAVRLEVPIAKLWSCYADGTSHCGRCESCSRLKRALTAGGQPHYLDQLFQPFQPFEAADA
ncbi:MAG: 7-cyano-7-deazaguanine synthase [Candidatus Melainabacteria bacterium HGW-Melainabacteria-1]|nr:MAG: 7-cyano-7-deazaguanine synthase [Candidatus Melainabacteria bacterium HGW-Melainabacteria-1]